MRWKLWHALSVDHEAVGIVEREDAVAGNPLEVQHDARGLIRLLSQSNVADHVIVVIEREGRIAQRQKGNRATEVEEQPRRVLPIAPRGNALHHRAER